MLNSYRVKFCAVLASVFALPLISFACGEGEYLVTAYYSPSPSQEYFLTGDYKSEIRLNGKGLFTASTMPVSDNKFAFVAADPCFEFGEFINISDMGNYVVLDRGGAIKDKRIDVWFGFGEAARKAAKSFGRQYKQVTYSKKVTPVQNFKNISLYYSFWDSILHAPKIENSEFGFIKFNHDLFDIRFLPQNEHAYHKRLLKYSEHIR